jgi:hypothetical protein
MTQSLLNKVNFIKDLSKVITTYKSGIEKLEYQVFYQPNYEYYQEYLVVTYDGGAISVRNCNGNSITAIFEEVSKLLDGGYYTEVRDLREIENDPTWIKLN